MADKAAKWSNDRSDGPVDFLVSHLTVFGFTFPTYLKRMQTAYANWSKALTIELQFVHFAAYSPALKLVE